MTVVVPIYIRVGKGRNGLKVDGSGQRNLRPLEETKLGDKKPIPTVEIGLNITLPHDTFLAPTLELGLRLEELGVAVEVEP